MRVIDCDHRYSQKQTGELNNLEEPRFRKVGQYGIHYITEGEGFFRINDGRFPLQHESVFVTFPEDSYSFRAPNHDIAFTYYELTFQLEDSDHPMQELLDERIRASRAYYPKRHLRHVFDDLTYYHASGSSLLAQAAGHTVAGLLFSLPDTKPQRASTAQAVEYVERAIDWMHGNINDHATLSELCSELNLTESHFIRLFHASQGVPPMKYFMRLKIDAAADALLETKTPVYEISEMFSFNSPGHFCRSFKQHMGFSPSQYRNQQIQDFKSKGRAYQKRIEEAYALLQTVIDASPDLVFFKDANSVYMGCNAAFCDFIGLLRQQIIGRSDYDIHPHERAEFFIKRDRQVLRYDRAFKNEETLVFPDGRSRIYQVYKAPFHNSAGRVIGLIGISRDITGLKNPRQQSSTARSGQ